MNKLLRQWEPNVFCLWSPCRYDFPWTPTKWIPFYGGAEYHDYHHYVGGQSQSNFASVFTYCDYIYGTDKVFLHLVLFCMLNFCFDSGLIVLYSNNVVGFT